MLGISTVILALVTLCLLFFQINYNTPHLDQPKWSSLYLGEYLQEPPGNLNAIYANYEDSLSVEITDLSLQQYKEYVADCQNLGYRNETSESDNRYSAYNNEGYEMILNYYQDQQSLDLSLNAPIQMEQITWPESEFGQMLPTPKSSYGRIETDDQTGLIICLGNTTKEDYNDYVIACAQNGFDLESEKTDTTYTAINQYHNILTVEYRGNQVIYISLQEPKFDTKISIDHKGTDDTNFYIDDNFIDINEANQKDTYSYIFTKGTHVLRVENAENITVSDEININITNDETLELEISCTNQHINIERKSHS